MADEDQNDVNDGVAVTEFRVSMHCNACERSVAKTISKVKGSRWIDGVEKFMTDMNQHKVKVVGKISPNKVLKKLRKRTGKRVEMVVQNDAGEDNPQGEGEEDGSNSINCNDAREAYHQVMPPMDLFMHGCCVEADTLMIFNDDNANACSLM